MTVISFLLIYSVGVWLCISPAQFLRAAERIAAAVTDFDSHMPWGSRTNGELHRPRESRVRMAGSIGLLWAVCVAYLGR